MECQQTLKLKHSCKTINKTMSKPYITSQPRGPPLLYPKASELKNIIEMLIDEDLLVTTQPAKCYTFILSGFTYI